MISNPLLHVKFENNLFGEIFLEMITLQNELKQLIENLHNINLNQNQQLNHDFG